MGVLGIVPFLLKKCPQAIESIPNRFHALEGKTIAIDGTLITQRLHFAADPRPHRHVLGWYQLIQELRQNKINVICVFDGKSRIAAKQSEVERRRLLRVQAQARGSWEKSRHERLLALTQTLQKLEALPDERRQEILQGLQVDSESLPLVGEYQPSLLLDTSLTETSQRETGALAVSVLRPDMDAISISHEAQLPDKLNQTPDLDHSTKIEITTPAAEELSTSATKRSQPAKSTEKHDLEAGTTSDTLAAQSLREHSLEKPVLKEESKASETESGTEVLDSLLSKLDEQAMTTRQSVDASRDAHSAVEDIRTLESDALAKTPSSSQETDIGVQDATSLEFPTTDSSMESIDVLDPRATLDQLSPQWLDQTRLKVGSLQNEDNKALIYKILDLYDHYNRTTTSGPDGMIRALTETIDVQDAPVVPISRVQLKYTQEEAKLWKEIVASPDSGNVNIAHVVEMVEQFASVELPSDEVPPEQEEVPPAISERSAKLEEQSGLMVASLTRRANPPTALTYAESRLILEAMGIPCIESYVPYEAEALASSLVLNGLADFVGSEDTDVLVYNAPLLRNMTNRQVPLQIIPPSVETGLGLSRAAFVDAAILMGTDFVRRLGGVGPSTAWRLMNTYGSIERMLEQESKFRPPDVAEYLEQVKVARMIFNSIPPVPSVEAISQGPWNEQAIFDVMSRFGLQRYLEEGRVIPDALSANYYNDESTNF